MSPVFLNGVFSVAIFWTVSKWHKQANNLEVHWIFNMFVIEAIWFLILKEIFVSLENAGLIPFNLALCMWSGTRNHPSSTWQPFAGGYLL